MDIELWVTVAASIGYNSRPHVADSGRAGPSRGSRTVVGLCSAFNEASGCCFASCKFAHKCSSCFRYGHGASGCRSASQPSGRYNNNAANFAGDRPTTGKHFPNNRRAPGSVLQRGNQSQLSAQPQPSSSLVTPKTTLQVQSKPGHFRTPNSN